MPIIIKAPERSKRLINNSSSAEIVVKRFEKSSLMGAHTADENGNRCYLSMLNGHLVDEVEIYRVKNGTLNQTTLMGKPLLSSIQTSEIEDAKLVESFGSEILSEVRKLPVVKIKRSTADSSLRDVSKGILMKRIEQSSIRTRLTKAGRPIGQDIGCRSLEESVTWALKHAAANEEDLKSLLFANNFKRPSKSVPNRKSLTEKSGLALLKEGRNKVVSVNFTVSKSDNVEQLVPSKIIKGHPRDNVSDQGLSGEVIKSRGQLQSFNFVKKSLPKSQPTKRPAPKVYSNEKVAEQISEENLILLSKYEDLYKRRLRSVMSEFVKSQEKVSSMQNAFSSVKAAVESTCDSVAVQSRLFYDLKAKQRRQILTLCDDREFRRPELMRARMQQFDMRLFEDGSGHGTVRTVNQGWDKIGARALQEMRANEHKNERKARWFTAYIAKLKDYVHRTKLNPPLSCLRFLVAIKLMLSRDWAIDKRLFFRILEETVKEKKDFKNIILHNTITAVRAAIGMESTEFLTYLNDRQIDPCPELLVAEADESKSGFKYGAKVSIEGEPLNESRGSTGHITALNPLAKAVAVVQKSIDCMHPPVLEPPMALTIGAAEVESSHDGPEVDQQGSSDHNKLDVSLTERPEYEIGLPEGASAVVRPSAPRIEKSSRSSFLRGKRLLTETTSLSAR